jgi:hypothetical protein
MRQFNLLARLLCGFAILAFSLAAPPEVLASPTCSDSKVKRLAREGKTVGSIARSCKLESAEVREILEEDADESKGSGRTPSTNEQSSKLRPGTPLAPCACWGFVPADHRQPAPACSSGFAVPRMCPQSCPAGGYAWRGVCG